MNSHQVETLDAIRLDPSRLAAVQATGLLDSEVEEVFDRLTRLAVKLVGVPAAFISLVDANRDFYKSACGFGEPLATARELTGVTFCHYTVQRTEPLIIPDTAADPVYRDVPTVRTLGVAAYVGVPLIVGGQTVGAFCSIDMKPRAWTTDEVEVLVELAASAQREMELRGAIATIRETMTVAEERRQELERSNDQLVEQAVELELQAEELHATTAHLEDRTEAAEEANKAKGGFLSMMSHELRTPLNAIGGYAELMEMGVCGSVTPQQLDYLSRIRRAGKHLQNIISEILDFTHLDSGNVAFTLENVVVDTALKEAAELFLPQLDECGITFTREGCNDPQHGTLCVARADPQRLQQILVNLMANAMKFTPSGGRISISAYSEGHWVRISVSDNGRGIPADQLARIFEPFVQIDRGNTPVKSQGVGLGLSICQQLARGMNGDISVTSTPGEGSTFTVSLSAASE